MSFSDRLKEARKKSSFTQKQLADMLEVTPAMIAQYETGKRKPKQDTLNRIAAALHLGYGYAPNGEPYFYCLADTVQKGDENDKFDEYQYEDAMAGDSDSKTYAPATKLKTGTESKSRNLQLFAEDPSEDETLSQLFDIARGNAPADAELKKIYKSTVNGLMDDMNKYGQLEIVKHARYIHSRGEYLEKPKENTDQKENE